MARAITQPGKHRREEPRGAAPASDAGAAPLTLFTPTIQTGSTVKVRRPRAGEGGIWQVTGQVVDPRPDAGADPAYDVTHTRTGRRRIFRDSRLKVVGAPMPQRGRGRSR